MPTNEATPSIGEQLRAALHDTGVSQRELGRRLSVANGGTPEDKRRWIQKVLAGEVPSPDMRPVTTALELADDYFTVTPRPQVRASRAALAEEVAELSHSVVVLLQVSVVLTGEVVKLGGEIPAEMREALARVAARTSA